MEVKIVGRALIVIFIQVDVLALVGKYQPLALQLLDENKQPIFLVKQGNVGDIGPNGIVFNDADKDGRAMLTALIPLDVKDKKKWVKDNFTTCFTRLEQIAPQILAAHDAAAAMEANIEAKITVE